ncbi:VOC family protein [Candidatus Woesearchaeota archaeon]|nr:VOC family protein [Candidatus Woesearchaeota archaeon]
MDKVVHFEIPVEDTSRAEKFYNSIFGWKIQNIPEMDYTLVFTAKTNDKGMNTEVGAINGGMMKRKDPIKNPVITISVSNIDDSLKKIEKLNGKVVMKKIKVGDMGYAAYFKDSEGNILGLWQNIKNQ